MWDKVKDQQICSMCSCTSEEEYPEIEGYFGMEIRNMLGT